MQASQIKQLKHRIEFYENPHSPSSENSIPTRQKKATAAREPGRAPARPGQKPGHKGVSHKRRPTREMSHVPDRCGTCSGRDLADPVPGRIEPDKRGRYKQEEDDNPERRPKQGLCLG